MGGVILYSLFVSLLLYLLFESVWSNVLSLVFKRRHSLTTDRKSDENQTKFSESIYGVNGKPNETDFTINRHSVVTNGVNKWKTNGCATKDHNGNVDQYRMAQTAGNVYVDMAHVTHSSPKANNNQSFNDMNAIRVSKL